MDRHETGKYEIIDCKLHNSEDRILLPRWLFSYTSMDYEYMLHGKYEMIGCIILRTGYCWTVQPIQPHNYIPIQLCRSDIFSFTVRLRFWIYTVQVTLKIVHIYSWSIFILSISPIMMVCMVEVVFYFIQIIIYCQLFYLLGIFLPWGILCNVECDYCLFVWER